MPYQLRRSGVPHLRRYTYAANWEGRSKMITRWVCYWPRVEGLAVSPELAYANAREAMLKWEREGDPSFRRDDMGTPRPDFSARPYCPEDVAAASRYFEGYGSPGQVVRADEIAEARRRRPPWYKRFFQGY